MCGGAWGTYMHLSMFSSRVGVAGIPYELDCQNSLCLQEFDRQLWHRGGTLDVSARNLEDIMSKFEGTSKGFLTQNCVKRVGN